ncbi:MAG: ABC transporter permease [Acidobacteriota bacterium]
MDRERVLATLTLALGLGAAAFGFTLLDGVLLRPLPFPEADRLYSLHHTAPGLELPRLELSDATYWLYRDSGALDTLGVFQTTSVEVTGDAVPERLSAARVSPEVLPMLGASPEHGRGFLTQEEAPEGPEAVLISAGYWSRRFGGDVEVLGRVMIVDGRPRTLVGVLPASFRFPSPEVDLWLPLGLDPNAAVGARFEYSSIARLPSGGATGSALADLRSRLARLAADYPQSRWTEALLESSALAPVLRPLKEERIGGLRDLIWAQAGALGLLLFAAFLNVATLLVARSEDRRGELAVRLALGAPRRQLITAQLAPALWIGAIAGLLALGVAGLGLHLLASHGPAALGTTRSLLVGGRTVAFTLVAAMVFAGALGLTVGLRRLRDPVRWLRSAAATPGQQRLRTALVVVQIGVASALSAVAGTLAVSLVELNRVEPGFELSSASSFDVQLPKARYPDAAAAVGFYARILDGLRALPGVLSAGGVHRLPLTGGGSNNGWSAEGADRGPDDGPVVLATRWASEGYFEALGIPLLKGRAFEPADREVVRPVAVVSQAFAAHFWGAGDPLGRRIALGSGEQGPWYTIVGVVGDVRGRGLREAVEPIAYLPLQSNLPRRESAYAPSRLSFVVRGDVGDLGTAVRGLVAELDPELPITRLGPLDRLAREDLATSRFAAGTLLGTVLVTGTLSLVGLFGLIHLRVRTRRRSFGVRLALGARPSRLVVQVLSRSLALTASGIALGLVAAGFAGGGLGHLVFGVSPVEPWIYLAVALLIALTALVATLGPALDAARTDPRRALRQD